MRLKKVEIAGFKSFMDPTCFVFEPGVTAVVGPNGCGKSNIVDAVRWAMGEQSAKAMRGRLMEDVLFSGSDAHKPLGMAEVKLTFENTNGNAPSELEGCTEIEVSRRLFRSGESEYSVNRVPCRRRDVWELFMDTGLGNRSYAIVEQDRVSRIIQAKPEERRVVIEEVAGISKYKSRREAAQRKMEATQQNLLRIQDIRREVGKQILGLERQAQKAKRYKELRRKIRELERRILLRQWRVHFDERESVGGQCHALEAEREKVDTDLQRYENGVQEDRLIILQKEREVTEAQENLHAIERRIKELEGNVEGCLRELQGLETMEGLLEKESSTLENRVQTTMQERERLADERDALLRGREEAEGRVRDLSYLTQHHREAWDQLLKDLDEAKAQLVTWMSERATLRNSVTHHQRQAEEIRRFLERRREEEDVLESRMGELECALEDSRSRIQEGEDRLEALQRMRSEIAEQVADLEHRKKKIQDALEEIRKELHGVQSRLRSQQELQDSLEGFGAGVKALRESNHRGEVLGGRPLKVLAEVLDFPEGIEAAVTGVLGERLQYFVVKEPEDALEAISFVRERNLGRVGFVPLRMKNPHAICDEQGAPSGGVERGLAQDLAWENGYEGLGEGLFRDVTLVEDAHQALEAWRSNGHYISVTHQGEVLHPSGIFEAGTRKDPTTEYLRRKREIGQLERKSQFLVGRESETDSQADELTRQIGVLYEDLDKALQEIRETEIRLAEERKELERVEESLSTTSQRMEVLHWEVHERSEELSQVQRSSGEEARNLVTVESHIREGEDRVRSMEEERAARQSELNDVQQELTQAQVRLAAVRERDEGLEREAHRLERQAEDLKNERDQKERQRAEGVKRAQSLKEKLQELRRELQAHLQRHQSAREALEALRRDLDEQRSHLQSQEKACQEGRKRQREVEQEFQELLLQHQKLVLQMEHLEGELKGRLEMDAQEIAPAAEDLPSGQVRDDEREVVMLKSSLERMGDVNLMAAEQYEELKGRYDFLTTQQEDLEESIRSLQKAIKKINRTSRKRFREAFAALNAQFSRVFPILFEGGEAHLLLADSPDVLDAGVEIVARPPGKRLQSISLLSGGEKALTAVALIFAMLMIKPTPFCLLDEVDAPLDDANIERFTQMVKELSKDSQFILVTHNKRTMEVADALYGVTMEAPGVSKLISVRLQ